MRWGKESKLIWTGQKLWKSVSPYHFFWELTLVKTGYHGIQGCPCFHTDYLLYHLGLLSNDGQNYYWGIWFCLIKLIDIVLRDVLFVLLNPSFRNLLPFLVFANWGYKRLIRTIKNNIHTFEMFHKKLQENNYNKYLLFCGILLDEAYGY